MSGRLAAIAAFLILTASPALACSAKNLDPNDLVENPVTWSANGRFCAIVRWHPTIADFTSERVGKVYGLDNPEPLTDSDVELPPPSPTVPAVLYELRGGARVLITEIALNANDAAGQLFVSNSGRYVVAFHRLGMGRCSGQSLPEDRFLAVYRIGAARVAAWNVGDFLGDYDIMQLFGKAVEVELRNESDEREIAALRIPASRNGRQPGVEERRIDLATASLLDPKHDIYPAPQAFAAVAGPGRHADGPARDCTAASATPIRLTSDQLLASATRGPLPRYPMIAYKARIRGIVTTELLISDRGDVLCVRSSSLPFGLSTAAEEAARRWKFKPYIVDGRPMPVIGEIAFHFADVDAETWASVTRGLPPSE